MNFENYMAPKKIEECVEFIVVIFLCADDGWSKPFSEARPTREGV